LYNNSTITSVQGDDQNVGRYGSTFKTSYTGTSTKAKATTKKVIDKRSRVYGVPIKP
jgi:hypothetical protein